MHPPPTADSPPAPQVILIDRPSPAGYGAHADEVTQDLFATFARHAADAQWFIDLDGGAPKAQAPDIVVVRAEALLMEPRAAEAVREWQQAGCTTIFFDPDPAATIGDRTRHPERPAIDHIDRFDLVVLYGEDPAAAERLATAYEDLGAQRCFVLEPAVDAARYGPREKDARYAASVAWLGTMPDDEDPYWQAFLHAAESRPQHRFAAGVAPRSSPSEAHADDLHLPPNLRLVEYDADTAAAFAASADLVIIPREAGPGADPVVARLLQAAASSACIVTEAAEVASRVLPAGRAFFVASSAKELLRYIDALDVDTARKVGGTAREHVMRHHGFDARVKALLQLTRREVKTTRRP